MPATILTNPKLWAWLAIAALRDWNLLLERVDALLPRQAHGRVVTVGREIDAVLAEWLRGQLLVVAVMSIYYVCALWIAGLDFAFPIGVITGIAVIIPYVGVITGLILATIAALLQFTDIWSLVWVWAAIGLGQVLEGMVITPLVVGERIGLHPVVVLLALPASAALLVGLRHLRAAYVAGPLYSGK